MTYASLRQDLELALVPSLGASGFLCVDRASRGRHGILENMLVTAWQAYERGYMLNFNRASQRDCVNCGNVAFVPNDLTVSIFARKLAVIPTPFQNIWACGRWGGAGNEFVLLLTDGATGTLERPSFFVNLAGTSYIAQSSTAATINKTEHICGVRRGTQLEIWLNAVLVGTAAIPTTSMTNANLNYKVGDTDFGTDQITNFAFDDNRVYSRALMPQEIRLLATEPGIGLKPERTSVFFGAQLFNAAWAKNSNQLISAGVI